MEQRDYWNSVAETKRFTTPFQLDDFARFVPKNAAILDVGCGYGRTLAELSANGYRNLSGVDFSEKLIERGRRETPGLDLQVSRRSTVERPNESVDAVLLLAVLTCVVDDAEQDSLIREVWRALKPGGVLCVDDFLLNEDARNRERYDNFLAKHVGKYEYGAFELPEGALLRHHSEERIRELFAPFETLEYRREIFETMNGHKSNGFLYFGRKPAAKD